jgi:hypothetical protein
MDLKFILKYLIWQGNAVAGLAALLGPDVKQMKIRRYSPYSSTRDMEFRRE